MSAKLTHFEKDDILQRRQYICIYSARSRKTVTIQQLSGDSMISGKSSWSQIKVVFKLML
jgi:hypothetical protein